MLSRFRSALSHSHRTQPVGFVQIWNPSSPFSSAARSFLVLLWWWSLSYCYLRWGADLLPTCHYRLWVHCYFSATLHEVMTHEVSASVRTDSKDCWWSVDERALICSRFCMDSCSLAAHESQEENEKAPWQKKNPSTLTGVWAPGGVGGRSWVVIVAACQSQRGGEARNRDQIITNRSDLLQPAAMIELNNWPWWFDSGAQ